MASSVQVQLSVRVSDNTDYTSPDFAKLFSQTESSAEFEVHKISAATGGTTLDLVNHTSIEGIFVKNNDSTNYVDVAITSTATATLKVSAGKFLWIPHCTVAADVVLTADTAACECIVIVIGT